MADILLIALAGSLGALSRYALSAAVHRLTGDSFPYGTLIVNILGCFLFGALLYFAEDRAWLTHPARTTLAVGFLGAFTTFATFGHETLELLRTASPAHAAANVAANVLLGLTAIAAARASLKALAA